MATFTLVEYETVTAAGDPVKPAALRTTGLAFGAGVRLAATTRYYETIPDANAWERVSDSGAAAVAGQDEYVYANIGGGGPVSPGARPYVYLTAA